jgi:hypothetical protein
MAQDQPSGKRRHERHLISRIIPVLRSPVAYRVIFITMYVVA